MSIEKISKWLIEQAKIRNVKGFTFIYDGTIASALLYLCAKRTNLQLVVVSVVNDKFTKSNNIHFNENIDNLKWLIHNSNYELVLSSYNYEEINFLRPWKHFTLIADLFPFNNMHKNDIDNMFASLVNLDQPDIQELFSKRSTQDSYYSKEFEVTHEELEWLKSADKIYSGIITQIDDPSKHPRWFSLSSRQKIVVSFINQNIKLTQHKLTSTGLTLTWK